jgi:SAM-dependent methyltransferase
MEMIYARAKRPEDLLWRCLSPSNLLVDAVQQRSKAGKALDLGCGAGEYAIYLAKQGYEVTGVDFVAKALVMAREQAQAEKVAINWVHADILDWRSSEQFDVILDSGTLHTISSRHLAQYKRQLLQWLSPHADYLLSHWGKRHPFDWRPIGPNRRTRQELLSVFLPELREKGYEQQIGTRIPFPIGPKVLFQSFRFQRA